MDSPSYKMVIFHSYVKVYQRVAIKKMGKMMESPGNLVLKQLRSQIYIYIYIYIYICAIWDGFTYEIGDFSVAMKQFSIPSWAKFDRFDR